MQRSVTTTPSHELVASEEWGARLRSLGRRVTKQRLAVLQATDRRPHSSADEIAAQVREQLPSISTQSVYVVLADLTNLDLVRKFEPPASPALYETRTGDNHHHAYCVRCGRVDDVDCAVGHAPCLTPSHDHGMQLLSAEVVYRGLCSACQSRADPESRL
ncbi:transcriptional repressor [Kocuria coralli]|uniref:Transcriptional repressor n=1 Tax=Kocuria coralli TaxID=1461025 RepID=A0A5J5L2P1_9MICC|nr:transcriptional repressor [Kocuria coralli]KAA9395261.1 transcriptional repressor [Kocuria coralli]